MSMFFGLRTRRRKTGGGGLVAAWLVMIAALGPAASAQEEAAPHTDGATIDSLIEATYDVISGPAGAKRDWDRFRGLFIEGALMIPRSAATAPGLRSITPEEYIERNGPYLEENGFFEMEIGRTVHRYGDVAQVMSAYAAKRAEEDPAPFMRGVNGFQLVHDGSRWWIASLAWQQESPALPVPEQYLR